LSDTRSHESVDVLDLREAPDPVILREKSGPLGGWLSRYHLLWQHRRLLVRNTGVGLLLFVIIALVIPSKYESITRLMPPEDNSSGMGLLGALAGSVTSSVSDSGSSDSSSSSSPISDLSSNLLGGRSQGALFIGVLRSRTVEDALIQRFDLRKVYGVSRWMAARKILEQRTEIAEDRKSKIIEIRVLDKSPERAQAMGRAYVEELNRAVNNLSTSSARREREFLENRLISVKQDLDQAAVAFSKFASQNSAIDVPEQGKAMVQAAAELQGRLMAAEAEEQGLRQIYTANNVRVRSMDSQIDELRQKLKDLGDAGTGADDKSGSPSALYPSIRKLPLLGVSYSDLYRRVKIQEAVFEVLTKQYEMAKVEEAKMIPTVRELDPADLPEKRATPNRVQVVIVGVIFSLSITCVWILGSTKWHQMDPEYPTKQFILQVASDLRRDLDRLKVRLRRSMRRTSSIEMPSRFE